MLQWEAPYRSQGASPNQQVTNSFFINNVAQNFFGGAISQEPCDPTFVASNNVLYANSEVRPTIATKQCLLHIWVVDTGLPGQPCLLSHLARWHCRSLCHPSLLKQDHGWASPANLCWCKRLTCRYVHRSAEHARRCIVLKSRAGQRDTNVGRAAIVKTQHKLLTQFALRMQSREGLQTACQIVTLAHGTSLSSRALV